MPHSWPSLSCQSRASKSVLSRTCSTSTSRTVKHRPDDEARFQLKYGSKNGQYHWLFLDETRQWITMLAGIDVEQGVIVSCDPIIHNPTLMFISIEYKDAEADRSRRRGWHTWQREKTLANRRDRRKPSDPVEVLVGCTQDRLLDLVLFERAARGLSPGHRMLVAEQWAEQRPIGPAMIAAHDALGDRLAALKLDANEVPSAYRLLSTSCCTGSASATNSCSRSSSVRLALRWQFAMGGAAPSARGPGEHPGCPGSGADRSRRPTGLQAEPSRLVSGSGRQRAS